MNKLIPFYYNNITELTEEEINSLQEKAFKILESYVMMVEDYETWKKSIKDYNKFQEHKHRKLDYSRYYWHKECEKVEKLHEEIEEKLLQTIILTVFPDAFTYNESTYYPVDYPQIFRLKWFPKIFKNYEEFSKDLDNLEKQNIFGFEDKEEISFKEIKDSVANFFEKFPKGIMFISNKTIKGDPD